MKIGILTGGGDCPGLNAVIRAVVLKSAKHGHGVIGIKNGWKGLVEGVSEPLTAASVEEILPRGGTILGSSRTNPFKKPDTVAKAEKTFHHLPLDALVAVGGEDTLGVARQFSERGMPVVGVPKTIDNDLAGTDQTFGFDTAVNIVVECIDRLRTTVESHHRVGVVEVMGRHAGWIAAVSAIASGADYCLVPEVPFDMEEICHAIRRRKKLGRDTSIIVVSEGAQPSHKDLVTQDKTHDEFGHVRLGGIGELVSKEIEKRVSCETRLAVLGHLQRGGTPSAFDRLIGTRYGLRAADLVHEKKFGRMVSLNGFRIVDVPLPPMDQRLRTLDMDLYRDAESLFG